MRRVDALTVARARIIASTVERLYERHPDWTQRWGPSGRGSCSRDVGFTLAFAEAALLSEDPTILVEYARWLARILRSRAVPVDSARESFILLADALRDILPQEDADAAEASFLAAGAALEGSIEAPESATPLTPFAARFLDALLKSDRIAVQEILQSAGDAAMGAARIADEIIRPAMAEVGARWARNEITVAEEHRATALAQAALSRTTFGARPSGARTVVVACVEGNLHSLGARVVADAFEADGWNVEYLGADVPTRDLIAFARTREVNLIALSIALPTHIAAAKGAVEALRRSFGPDCPRIIVGGKPARDFARGVGSIAADAVYMDAASGVSGTR